MLSLTKDKQKPTAFIIVDGVASPRVVHTTGKKKVSWSPNYAWKSKSPLKYSIQHLQTMLEADSQYVQHSQFFFQCSNRWLILWVSTRWSSWLAFEAILSKKYLSLNTSITHCNEKLTTTRHKAYLISCGKGRLMLLILLTLRRYLWEQWAGHSDCTTEICSLYFFLSGPPHMVRLKNVKISLIGFLQNHKDSENEIKILKLWLIFHCWY